jgi:hypothetical protein
VGHSNGIVRVVLSAQDCPRLGLHVVRATRGIEWIGVAEEAVRNASGLGWSEGSISSVPAPGGGMTPLRKY